MTDWLEIAVEDLPSAIPAAQRGLLLSITDRQFQVLQLLCLGKSNKEIAQILDCSPRTIEIHRGDLKLRMGCKTCMRMVIVADRMLRPWKA